MAEQSFTQNFDGYWRESNKNGLPKQSGIYCVYECTYNESTKYVSITKLLYIGESEDVNQRIANHERLEDWKKQLSKGCILCYSFTPISSNFRTRVEAALIKAHRPICNTEYVNEFPFERTNVTTKGQNYLLKTSFSVD